MNNTNLICGMINAPGASGPNIFFLGNTSSAAACATLATANATHVSWTWVGPDVNEYALGCYARTDVAVEACFPVADQACASPCFVSVQARVCLFVCAFVCVAHGAAWTVRTPSLECACWRKAYSMPLRAVCAVCAVCAVRAVTPPCVPCAPCAPVCLRDTLRHAILFLRTLQAGVVSAVGVDVTQQVDVWTREFESLSVVFFTGNMSATLTPKTRRL
jgi:hypothetical protein